jgi:FKBP-type peptidyl-prolyl cis-trans isomerase SlyD
MKIENNLMVSLIYELHEGDNNGKIIEKIEDSRPLNFLFGTGKLLPAFESNLQQLSKGEEFNFLLGAPDAYGDRMEDMIIDVPILVFHKDGKIDESVCQIGNEVPMMDGSGNPLYGIINEVSDTFVKMDFNHPMAGVDLYFSGKVLDVREPSQEELAGPASSCSSCGSGVNSGCSGKC